jgi:hypothetical protein
LERGPQNGDLIIDVLGVMKLGSQIIFFVIVVVTLCLCLLVDF